MACHRYCRHPKMTLPKRIQLKRTKGWRKPENTVIVSRPGKWGNPFSVETYGRKVAVEKYGQRLKQLIAEGEIDLSELRGKNLACWCGLNEACHADVLLELANGAKKTL